MKREARNLFLIIMWLRVTKWNFSYGFVIVFNSYSMHSRLVLAIYHIISNMSLLINVGYFPNKRTNFYKGITIRNEEAKSYNTQITKIAVLSDISLAKILFELYGFVKEISDHNISRSKTEGMWIGLTKDKKKTFGIKWPNEPIKALGVHIFTYGAQLLRDLGVTSFVTKIKPISIYTLNDHGVSSNLIGSLSAG